MEKVEYIWLNGKLVSWDKAKIHVLSHTLHYGSGVFEGIRFYETDDGQTAIFRLEDHIRRLFNSAATLEMTPQYTKKEIIHAIIETVKENKIKNGYIRPLIFYGYGKMGLKPDGAKLSVCIAVWPWNSYLGEKLIDVKTSKYIRIHPDSTDTNAKICGHYSNSLLAHLDAKNEGYDEALLLDYNNNVAEGPVENIFAVRNNILITPTADNILSGITRDSIIEVAKDINLKVEERNIDLNELKKSDELFFTGTASEITGIKKIDNVIIGDECEGPITNRLKNIYSEIVRGNNDLYLSWLTYV